MLQSCVEINYVVPYNIFHRIYYIKFLSFSKFPESQQLQLHVVKYSKLFIRYLQSCVEINVCMYLPKWSKEVCVIDGRKISSCVNNE
jgi:hypothetical protein